jgi:hypothetical protein
VLQIFPPELLNVIAPSRVIILIFAVGEPMRPDGGHRRSGPGNRKVRKGGRGCKSWQQSWRHRQLVASGRLNLRYRQGNSNLLPTHTADFGPDLEFVVPGSSVLGGSDMIRASAMQIWREVAAAA